CRRTCSESGCGTRTSTVRIPSLSANSAVARPWFVPSAPPVSTVRLPRRTAAASSHSSLRALLPPNSLYAPSSLIQIGARPRSAPSSVSSRTGVGPWPRRTRSRSTSSCIAVSVMTRSAPRPGPACRPRLDRRRCELRVQRIALHERARSLKQTVTLAFEAIRQRHADHLGNLAEVVLHQAARRQGRSADSQSGRVHRRALVERDRVPVHGDPHLLEPTFRRLA